MNSTGVIAIGLLASEAWTAWAMPLLSNSALPVLTSIAEIRQLTPEQAALDSACVNGIEIFR